MKGIYVIAIAFLASCAVNATSIDLARSISKEDIYLPIYTYCPVPQPNRKNTTTNIAHENDCTKFYKCHMGRPIVQDCPLMIEGDPVTRLHYNRRLEVCDWPWQAGCERCPEVYPNGTSPGSSKINDEYGSCSQYYECVSGVPYPRTCPPGTCFSRTCQDCVVNRNAGNCYGTIPTPTPSSTPPRSTTTPGRCINNDKTPHHCDCAKFYLCINDDWFQENCYGGLHFSPIEKICLPPNKAGCLNRT